MWEYLAGNVSHSSVGPGDQWSRQYFFFGCNLSHPQETRWVITVLADMQVAGHIVMVHHDQELASCLSK